MDEYHKVACKVRICFMKNLREKNVSNDKIPPRLRKENRGGMLIMSPPLEPLVTSVVKHVNQGLNHILKDFSTRRFDNLSSMESVSNALVNDII